MRRTCWSVCASASARRRVWSSARPRRFVVQLTARLCQGLTRRVLTRHGQCFATHRRGYRRARDAGTRDFRSATAARTFSATLPKRLQKITDVAASSGRFRRRIKEMFARAPESRTCSGCASRATGVRDAWRRIAPLESSPSLGRRSTVVAHGVASKARRLRVSRRPPHRSRGRVAERFIARDARAHIARDVMRCPRSRRRNGTARVDRGVA